MKPPFAERSQIGPETYPIKICNSKEKKPLYWLYLREVSIQEQGYEWSVKYVLLSKI